MTTLVAPVELCSEYVLLRPYRIEDANVVAAAALESVDTVGRWMAWCHAGYTEAESIAWIERCQVTWQSGEAYEIVAASENGASRRVAEKAGARFECLARNRLVIHGVPLSAAVHSLVPTASV